MSEYPAPPANLAAYVDVLGTELAATFLLSFGGSEVYLSENPQGRSKVEQLIGREKTRELARRSANLSGRVPVAKRWLAQVLRAQGLPVAEIARRLHVTDVTVRKYLSGARDDDRQLPLF